MNSLKINGKTTIPLDTILRIVPLSDQDRMNITEKLENIDASQYNTRVEFKRGKSKLAVETLDDIRKQGIALVNLGKERFVPALNILSATDFTKDDTKALEEKDYVLKNTFRSAVNTVAGRILSQATPEQVIARRDKALGGFEEKVPANG